MSRISNDDREKIRQAVSNAEKKTSGEFVTVIARKSDDYLHVPFLWASIFSLLIPPVIMYLFNHHDADFIFRIQALVFLIVFSILQLDALKMFFVPRRVRNLRSTRNAFLQFHNHGVSSTKNRSGIMLFVSEAEKFVQIIADEGIHKKVPEGYWDNIIKDFLHLVRKGQTVEGFISAINKCNDILSREFPIEKDDVNELPDRLIEI